ncbi:STE-domain-containing protein [Backusella circina FSU 941]|nr:STE-domain-containing protein [Backusella circina FSU 941]
MMQLPSPSSDNTKERLLQIEELKRFLGTATSNWDPYNPIRSFSLPMGESLSCVYWNELYYITGTDIVRTLLYRFHLFGRPVTNLKKFEEGVFSDLRNLKPGTDAALEEPKSDFLDMLYKNNCIRTQKKQKVFYWFSVPHDRLFLDALERDLKRDNLGMESASAALAEPATSLSLEESQELFEQLRKSMSMSAMAAAHALDESMADDSFQGSMDDNAWYQTRPERPAAHHRATRSLSDIPISTVTSPVIESCPSPVMDPAEKEHQKKIFGVFSLFEGSPTYKQRQRRRAISFNSGVYPLVRGSDGCLRYMTRLETMLFNDPDRSRLELTALYAGLTIDSSYLMSGTYIQKTVMGEHGPEKAYSCPFTQCARLFKRLEHLKRHVRTHTMERPYACTQCGKSFSRSDNLSQHKKTHIRSAEKLLSKKNKQKTAIMTGLQQNEMWQASILPNDFQPTLHSIH